MPFLKASENRVLSNSDGVEVPIAVYFEATKKLSYYAKSEIRWHSGYPPLDGVRVTKDTAFVDIWVFGGMSAMALVGLVLASVFLAYNVTHMNCK